MRKIIKKYKIVEGIKISKPEIKPNESETDYVSRCIPWIINNEGLTGKQAAGKCHGMYQGGAIKK